MRQTSLISYVQLNLDVEVLGKRQQDVYTFICSHPGCSDREIVRGLGLPINCITGRRNELIKMGFVKQQGVKYDAETNRYVCGWESL